VKNLVLALLIGFLAIAAGCGTREELHTARLVGTEWLLALLVGEEPIAGSETTLRFEQEYLTGHMGCNRYGGGPDSGKYEATADGRLSIGPLAVTVQLCSEPEGIMEQEAVYAGALQSGASWRLMDGGLKIADASGETVLVFARQE
jgi:heat shock protein HslJ